MSKKSKIRESARGQACMVRIPGVCNFDPETTVAAHLNGGGLGKKMPDLQVAYCCSSCHDALDGRYRQHEYTPDEIAIFHYEGVFRTQQLLLEQGLINTPGSIK